MLNHRNAQFLLCMLSLPVFAGCALSVRAGGAIDAAVEDSPQAPPSGDVVENLPLPRVEVVFHGVESSPFRASLASLSAVLETGSELSRSPLMTPGSICRIERIGSCRLYSPCDQRLPALPLILGTLTVSSGSVNIRAEFAGTAYPIAGHNGPWNLDPTVTFTGTGSGQITPWRSVMPVPVLTEFAGPAVASINRREGLRVAFAPRATNVGSPIVLLGTSSGPILMCTFAPSTLVGDIAPEVLGRLPPATVSFASGTILEQGVTAGSRSFTVATVLITPVRSVPLN